LSQRCPRSTPVVAFETKDAPKYTPPRVDPTGGKNKARPAATSIKLLEVGPLNPKSTVEIPTDPTASPVLANPKRANELPGAAKTFPLLQKTGIEFRIFSASTHPAAFATVLPTFKSPADKLK
jgi:hypothetical protein